MKIGNIIVYDIETGGFSKEKNGLAEIAMIAIDIVTLEEVDRYEAVIAPYDNLDGERVTYTAEALKVNGLTMKQIENGKPAKDVIKEMMAFAKKHKRASKKPMLCGHNIEKFDNPWIDYFFLCHKKDAAAHFENWCIDTMWWAALKWPLSGEGEEILDHKLGTCCDALGIKLSNAHSAMPDTEANAKMAIAFIKSLRGDSIVIEQEKKERTRTSFQM